MTPAEQQALIDEAVYHLRRTTVGYANHTEAWQNTKTSRWWQALDKLARVRASLDPVIPPPPPPPVVITTGWPTHGIATGYKILNRPQADFDFELNQIQAVGAQFVRADSLPSEQAKVDRFVNGVIARGMEPLLVLHGTTNAITPVQAAEFAQAQAAKWKGRVRLFEFCNEPDLNKDWTPATYTAAARAAYPALKQGNPNAKLIVGALWKWKDTPGQQTVEWVQGMYAAGLKGHMDALSLHLYNDPFQRGNWNIWDWAFHRTPSIRSVMDANGDQQIPICSTENGENSVHGEDQQAKVIANNFKALTTYPLAFHTVYSMMDDDVAGFPFGLLRLDRTRRPSWAAYRAAA